MNGMTVLAKRCSVSSNLSRHTRHTPLERPVYTYTTGEPRLVDASAELAHPVASHYLYRGTRHTTVVSARLVDASAKLAHPVASQDSARLVVASLELAHPV